MKIGKANFGKRPPEERFHKSYVPEPNTGCWLWLYGGFKAGYGEFHVNLERQNAYAHRYSYEIHKGEIPKGMVVRHQCDQPACVNPDHLILGTKKQNSEDMVRRRRSRAGMNNPKAKINDSIVIAIKEMYLNGGVTQYDVAEKFSIDQAMVSRILNGKAWKTAQ